MFFLYYLRSIAPCIQVTERIIKMAGVMYECDRCVGKHDISLRLAATHLMEISQIDTNDWDLLKFATALMMICYPKEFFLTTPQVNRNMLGM